MGKTLIKVSCVDQRLTASSAPLVASGGMNEDEVEFSFCPLWDGLTKTAVFYRDKNTVYNALLTDDKAVIPQEVLKSEGTLYFGVFGVNGDVRRTSEILTYKIKAGAITTGTTPPEPTPDIYAQIIAALESKQDAEAGKGLSTNDYTNAEKAQLANVAAFTVAPEEYELSGNPVQLDNYEGMPMDVIATFAPKQTGSGDPSPTNIRAITGWTGAKLTKCGKNLLNADLLVSYRAIDTDNGNVYTSSSGNYCGTEEYIPITPGVTIAISQKVTIVFYDINKTFIKGGMWASVVVPDNAAYFRVDVNSDYKDVAQVEIGSTATDYEPYHGDTFAADFGQTVYGGTLDWNTGVLTVDTAIKSLDGTEGMNDVMETSGVYRLPIYGISDAASGGGTVSSHFIHSQLATSTPNTFWFSASSKLMFLTSSTLKTNDEWKAWLSAQYSAGTPVQVCYKLATPTTIQLTAHEIAALRGANTLYGDGTLTVSGRKDILWLTEKLTQRVKTLESAIVAMGGNV